MTLALAATGCAALLDKDPPQLTTPPPTEGPVRELSVEVTVADAGTGLASFTLAVDGGDPVALVVPPEGALTWTPDPPLPDGPHTLVFTATDRAWTPNVTTATVERSVDATGPTFVIAPSSRVAHQGKTWALWVKAEEPLFDPVVRIVARGDDKETKERTLPLYPVDGAWRALRGVEIQEVLGPRPIVVSAKDALGNTGELASSIDVRETAFEEGGFIKLTKKQTEARKDEAAIQKMREERNAAYATALPDVYWRGTFVSPIPEAEMTSPFGKYRSYSDGKKSHHTGLDLSEERGTPVATAAGGKVLVAHEMAIFGNVVIVHHGQGVCTSYNHLDAIDVKEGDTVQAGQVIGKLGSTGQSTGPHLHWGMEVGEVAVDPGEWLTESFEVSPFRAETP